MLAQNYGRAFVADIGVVADAMVFLGDGEGGFLPPTVTRAGKAFATFTVQLGDVTGDGLADIVMEPRVHPGDHFLVESVDATTLTAGRSLGHVALLLQLVDFDDDGTLDIAGRSYERFFIDVALGAGAFETRWFDLVPFGGIVDFKVAPPIAGHAARLMSSTASFVRRRAPANAPPACSTRASSA